jgi:hypothetical protein
VLLPASATPGVTGAAFFPGINGTKNLDTSLMGQLLCAIDGYDGQRATHAALRLAPYVFVRPDELRAAAWNELDLERGESGPGELHIVSPQASRY